MNKEKRSILPKEKNMDSLENICNISEYLNRVNIYIKQRRQGDSIVVYRGEPDVYNTPCRPNIFRKDVLNDNHF